MLTIVTRGAKVGQCNICGDIGKLTEDHTPPKGCNNIGNILKSQLIFPNVVSIKTKPQRVMRSLLGHLSAQGVDRYHKDALTALIRDYFLDETRHLPESLKIYFWLYPDKHQIIIRDCGYADIRVNDHVLIWLLKFYPVAFLVTFNEPNSFNFAADSLSIWRNEQIDYEVDVPIDLKNFPPVLWPEVPTNKYTCRVYGREAVVSFDRKK